MIIKVKTPYRKDGWFVFDNAEEIAYSRHPNIRAFFHDTMGATAVQNIIATNEESGVKQGSFFHPTPEPMPLELEREGWFIAFSQKTEQGFELWGDTEIYLLNDNGKTIERIFNQP